MVDSYKDIDGNPCTLQALCRKEPEWAASQIRTLKDYTTGNEQVIATLRARVEELEAALVEIWSSVPATYDNDDPMVQRHARALNAVASLLKERSGK